MSSDITFVDTFLCNSIKESKESLCDKFINGPLHRPHAPDPSIHYGWNRLQIKANFSCVLQVLCLPGKTVWNIRIWQIYSSFIWIIVTRCFFYMKTVKIKVIQNCMEITFYIKTYSKRTCWKKFFKFKFWHFFFDIWRQIRLQAMATRQQLPTNQNKNIVSKIETENKMLNNIFQQVLS